MRPGPAAETVITGPSGLPRLLSAPSTPDLASHLSLWGPRPAGGAYLHAELEGSGLTGRGGAAFPTAVKWASVGSRRNTVVVANGTEGEPASSKDKTLLARTPHMVLDGLALAAETLGAGEAIICVDHAATAALRSLRHAVAERTHYSVDSMPLRVEAIPSGYVTGEESALVHWLNGGPALPTSGPKPFLKGVHGRPTLVNNVETLAHVAMIARFGSSWFRQLGTHHSPGSALVTVTGDVAQPSVYEIELGARLSQIVGHARPTCTPRAVLVGGYAGTWLTGGDLTSHLLEGRPRLGPALGCGSLLVVGERSCGLKATAAIARWMAGQSARQCGPCLNGLPSLADALERLARGDHSTRWRSVIDRWLWMVEGRGACKHPDGTARMIRSAISTFADEIDRHATRRSCPLPAPPLPLPA